MIGSELAMCDISVTWHRIGFDPVPDMGYFDLIFLGTFTWDYGETPEEVKDFVLDVDYKPGNMAIFGTGDTQFGGEELFCAAADRLAKFYGSPLDPLKIEQSPRGAQEAQVYKWARGLYKEKGWHDEYIINESKSIGAETTE